jgi:hypothetical protein
MLKKKKRVNAQAAHPIAAPLLSLGGVSRALLAWLRGGDGPGGARAAEHCIIHGVSETGQQGGPGPRFAQQGATSPRSDRTANVRGQQHTWIHTGPGTVGFER